jgi:hypothetical protein
MVQSGLNQDAARSAPPRGADSISYGLIVVPGAADRRISKGHSFVVFTAPLGEKNSPSGPIRVGGPSLSRNPHARRLEPVEFHLRCACA